MWFIVLNNPVSFWTSKTVNDDTSMTDTVTFSPVVITLTFYYIQGQLLLSVSVVGRE